MTFFATRSSLVLHYVYKCRDLLHRINGPVSTIALHEMRGLYMELGLKIAKLERMGHWDRPGITTAKPATTNTEQPGPDRPGLGSVRWSRGDRLAFARRKRGTKTTHTKNATE